jgi:geranylgeranyl diphosphate synthase, type I
MSDLKATIQRLHDAYMPAILRLTDEVVRAASPADTSLVSMLDYHMLTGGKRLRALLPLAVAEALGVDPAQLVPFGAACEILHNATLVHDDLQDGDTMRRDQATVWVRFGEARAINLGDAMLYWTLELADKVARPLPARHASQRRIVREALRVIDGQEREFLLKDMERPALDAYIQMVEGKTSGLFSLPVAGAAALCEASEALITALEVASGHLGVVFQIQDDVLDLYGDKGRDQRGSDVAEGKISMLVVHALAHAPEADAAWLREVLRRERDAVSADDVTRAIALFESSGAVRAAFAEIDRRVATSLEQPALREHPALLALVRGMADVFLAPVAAVRAVHGG